MTRGKRAKDCFARIPENKLPAFIGKGVHVGWAWPGCCWILREIVGDRVVLQTPTTGKKLGVKASDIYYTRKHSPISE